MRTLRLTNTFSDAVEPFTPPSPEGRPVRLYSCGPTVYSFAHIGNFRTFLFSDVLRRVLERSGYAVRHVMNVTDVGHMTQDHLADAIGEDKLSRAARELGWDPYQVAQHFLNAFVEDARALRLKNFKGDEAEDAALHPRATRYVPEMLALIQTLIERGHAYVDSGGQVYFAIKSFPEYGCLSHKDIDELIAGARVDVRDEKNDPRDFALWKVDEKHLMQWDPHSSAGWFEDDWLRLAHLVPQGIDPRIRAGFPGWHIECSAMAHSALGDIIDVHTGGEDNLFPHHECENAQTCGAFGTTVAVSDGPPRTTFARFWLHGRHLLVDGRKMSKRDGTFFTVRDLLDPKSSEREGLGDTLRAAGFTDGAVPASVLRLTLCWGHYRQSMNFSVDMLVQSRAFLGRLQSLYDRAVTLSAEGTPSDDAQRILAAGVAAFDDALADDLHVDRALAGLSGLIDELNKLDLSSADATAIRRTLEDIDEVLDVLEARRVGAIERTRLAQWQDAEFCRSMGEAWSHWHARAQLRPLVDTLRNGELPAAEALSSTPRDAVDHELIELFVARRHLAKRTQDFATADAIRDELKRRGITLQDSKDVVRWTTASTGD